jgi:hypothetical protein
MESIAAFSRSVMSIFRFSKRRKFSKANDIDDVSYTAKSMWYHQMQN